MGALLCSFSAAADHLDALLGRRGTLKADDIAEAFEVAAELRTLAERMRREARDAPEETPTRRRSRRF